MPDLKSATLYNIGLSGARATRPDVGPQEIEGQYAGEFYKGYKSADLGEDLNGYLMAAAKAYRDGDIERGKKLESVAAEIQQTMQHYRPRVQNLTDARSPTDLINWTASSAGNVRSSAKPALGGLAGAAVGSLVGMPVAGAAIGSSLAGYDTMADEAGGSMMSDKDVRARVEAGEIGYDDVVSQARLSGALQAPLEGLGTAASMLPFVGSAKKVALKELTNALGRKLTAKEMAEFETKELAKEIAEKGVKRYVGQKAALGAGGEFSTEFGQSLVGQEMTNDIADNGKPLDFVQALNEGAAGAVVGGGMGAATALPASLVKEKGDDTLPPAVRAGEAAGRAAGEAKDAIGRAMRPKTASADFLMFANPLPEGLDDQQLQEAANVRNGAAVSFADKILAEGSHSTPEEMEAAAQFKSALQTATDPAQVDAAVAKFRDDFASVNGKQETKQGFIEGLTSFLGATQRKGNAQSPRGIAQEVAQGWMQRNAKLTEIFPDLDVNDAQVRNGAQALFDWVSDGMPNFDRASVALVQMWGQNAPEMLRSAYHAAASEGIAPKDFERMGKAVEALTNIVKKGDPRRNQLAMMVRESMQDQVTTADIAQWDRTLQNYVAGNSKLANKDLREALKRDFGAFADDVLALYERADDEILNAGESSGLEDGDDYEAQQDSYGEEAGDWNSGVQDVRGPQVEGIYHVKHDKAAMASKRGEIVGSGLMARVQGMWDRLKQDHSDAVNLRDKEDDLIRMMFNDDPHVEARIKNEEERQAMLRYINRTFKAMDSVEPSQMDAVDLTEDDVKSMKDYKAGGDKGRIVLKRKDGGDFYVSVGNIIKTMRKKLGAEREGGNASAEAHRMLMAGLSSLMNTEQFTGEVSGLDDSLNDPYTGMSYKQMREAALADDSDIASINILRNKYRELMKKAREIGPDDPAKGNKLLAFAKMIKDVVDTKDEKKINEFVRSLRGWEDKYENNSTDKRTGRADVVPSEVDGIDEIQRDSHGNSLSMYPDPRQKFDSMDVSQDAKPEKAAERMNMKQINFIFDNLKKGVPSFVAAVNKASAKQKQRIIKALNELIAGKELGELQERGETALKQLRGKEEPARRGNAMAVRIGEELGKEGIHATHDSPARHDGKFNWREHQGKGEGNASFGAGTYLSTADGVHKSYKEAFTASIARDNAVNISPSMLDTMPSSFKSFFREMFDAWAPEPIAKSEFASAYRAIESYKNTGKVPTGWKAVESHFKDGVNKQDWAKFEEVYKYLVAKTEKESGFEPNKSPTYEVTVKAKPEEMLDWDAPLSEQSELVKKALARAGYKDNAWRVNEAKENLAKAEQALKDVKQELRNALNAYSEAVNNDPRGEAIAEFEQPETPRDIEMRFIRRTNEAYDAIRDAKIELKQAREHIDSSHKNGSNIYRDLVDKLGSQAAASDYLQSLGIVGHKYASSAGKNDKFPNYVIYDDSRIETNYIHFSAQQATGQITEKQQKQVREELVKTLGDKIKLSFEKIIRGNKKGQEWSGEWTEGAIRISLKALDPLGVGRHEAVHQLMSWLRKAGAEGVEEVLKTVASNPMIQRQLARQLQNDPAALEQLKDPEEAAAYLYQFWRAGKISLGPKVEGFFNRALQFMREITGLISREVRDLRHAEQILQAFGDGAFAGNNTQAMLDLEAQIKADRDSFASGLWKAFLENDVLRKVAFTAGDVLRDMKNPALTELADMLYTPEGAKMGKQSFFDAVPQQRAVWFNKLNTILKGVEQEDAALVLDHLQKRTDAKKIHDKYVREKVEAIRSYLGEMYDYAVTRGVMRYNAEQKKWEPMGKVLVNYFPRVFDIDKITSDRAGFTATLLEHHRPQLESMAKEIGGVTAEEIAENITDRIINVQGNPDITESNSQLGITPAARAVNKRDLTWLKDEFFTDYMGKDISDILTSYTSQMVKRAEYTHRFGNEGEVIQQHLDRAYIHEATGGDSKLTQAVYDEHDLMVRRYHDKVAKGDKNLHYPTLREATDKVVPAEKVHEAMQRIQMPIKAIMAAEGTIGRDIDETFRTASSMMIFYQNLRLLTLSLFSSLIDPLGIVVRGGTLQDAYDGFVRGIKEIKNQISGQYSADELTKLAEALGTVDSHNFLDALGQTYSSLYMTGKLKHMNDKLFRLNGMEAWNRAMRIQATGAAISFIKKHLDKPNDHSKRYLAELGLTPETKFSLNDSKVQEAVVRWVNGAILRPNAMQRPIYASDPHYAMLYHLKQFTYSFHKTILQRAFVEAQHGNLTPAVSLVGLYVPMMIAADVMKEVLVPGDEPAWMKAGLGSAVSHGVMRANLLGVPQLAIEGFSNPLGKEGVFGTVDRSTKLFGPTVEETFDWLMVPLTEKYSFGETAVRSMPHSPILSRLLL